MILVLENGRDAQNNKTKKNQLNSALIIKNMELVSFEA